MIFVTGDTHGGINMKKLSHKNFEIKYNLTRKDYVIVAGDFGFIWKNRSKEQKEYWNDILTGRPYTLLFIDGNHEDFELLNSYPVEEWSGGKVHKIADNIIHLMRGQVYIIDGVKIFTFGGATSIDTLERIYGVSWWKEELPSYQDMDEGIENLKKNNWEIDYIITHCCSAKSLKTVSAYGGFKYNYDIDVLNKYFDFIEENLKYKHWYYGHYHLDINHIVDNQTVIYNRVVQIK